MDYSRYCSLTFDGKLIDELVDGYVTINVEGRGVLNRVLSTVDVPGRDGTVVTDQRLPARPITVYYLLKALNSRLFQQNLNYFHDLLKSDGDVVIQFGDEDYYRFGRLSETENPPYDSLQGIGSVMLLCQDPYKYRDIEAISGTSVTLSGGSLYPYRIRKIEVTITENRTGFQITNSVTGRKIILTGEFTAGQVLQILPEERNILLNGQGIMNRLDYVHSDWRQFEIYAGQAITAPQSMTFHLSEREL